MTRKLLAAAIGALLLTGMAAQAGGQTEPSAGAVAAEATEAARKAEDDARWEELRAQSAADAEERRLAQERYEQGVRDAEEAQARFEADSARHQAEVARARAAEEEYQRQRADYERQVGGNRGAARPERDRRTASTRPPANASADCEQRQQRSRRTGRAIGGAIGGIAGGLAGRNGNRVVGLVAGAAIGTVLGDVISRLLDCEEQVQAADATERAVAGGVGTTESWSSDTRPGVSGSSTVLALEADPGGGQCMTVSDVVIIDGEETRAPKRMCRRPPSTRFVRV